jgi:hypothetical protein
MKQAGFSDVGYALRKRTTKREECLVHSLTGYLGAVTNHS